jgi:uncharacterized membrane protein
MSSPEPGPLAGVIARNITALLAVRRRMERKKRLGDRISDGITAFTGSVWGLLLHAVLYGGWLLTNSGLLGIEPWDPFPFVMLAMIASVEAIFLSTFVLISQNRMAQLAERRAELDLQVNLLAEHEITRLMTLVRAIAAKLEVPDAEEQSLDELERDVRPDEVLKEMDRLEERGAGASARESHPPPGT